MPKARPGACAAWPCAGLGSPSFLWVSRVVSATGDEGRGFSQRGEIRTLPPSMWVTSPHQAQSPRRLGTGPGLTADAGVLRVPPDPLAAFRAAHARPGARPVPGPRPRTDCAHSLLFPFFDTVRRPGRVCPGPPLGWKGRETLFVRISAPPHHAATVPWPRGPWPCRESDQSRVRLCFASCLYFCRSISVSNVATRRHVELVKAQVTIPGGGPREQPVWGPPGLRRTGPVVCQAPAPGRGVGFSAFRIFFFN